MNIDNILNQVWNSTKQLWTSFVSKPIRSTLRFMAIVLLIEVILGLIGTLTRIQAMQNEFVSDPVEMLILIFIAWVLFSGRISRVLVSIFLLFVFILSTAFIIIPLDQIVNIANKSMESERVTYHRFDFTLSGAKTDLDYYSSSPMLSEAQRRDLKNVSKRLSEIQKSISKEELYPVEKFMLYMSDALQYFLKQGAPFIFAMLMGALGSSIIISNQLIKNYAAQPAIWYIYRLAQGMVMALLLVYGFAAGMLSLGTQQPIQMDKFDEIKYFIGFISALAGLFSEQAFAKLREISKTLFGYKTGVEIGQSGEKKEPGSEETKGSEPEEQAEV